MKWIKHVRVLCALAAALAVGIGLAASGWAQAQLPSVGQSHLPPAIHQPGQIPALSADLSCSITGSYDQAGQKPFQNNGFLASGGVIGSEWIHVTVANAGPGTALNFQLMVQTSGAAGTSNGASTYTISVNPNASQTIHKQIFTNGPGSFQVTVSATADSGNKIADANKSNNSCSFKYHVENVA